MTRLVCLVTALCFLCQSLILAAPETIRVNAGNQTFQVTPGQWISVNQGPNVVNYNVRYINGRPVALNEKQYYQMVFGDQAGGSSADKSIAEKVSESNPGVIPDRQSPGEIAAPSAGKPVPFSSTAEGKIQKSSIRAGLTTAVKVLSGKTGAAKPRPDGTTKGITPASPENTPQSKVDVGLAKASSKIKSGFDPKNILLRAGVSVGVELATQIVRGEKPSAKKALKVVASAEFAGNVAGSALGAAAGAFMVPFLAGVPVIGGALSALAPTFGAIAGGSYGAYLAGDLKNGKFSLRDAFNKMNWVDVTGRSIGATIGGFLGATLFPPFGIFIGGIVGGTVGAIVAKKLWGILGGKSDLPVDGKPVSVPGSDASPGREVAIEGSSVSIGTVENTGETSPQNSASEIRISATSEPVGSQEARLAEAFSKYKELYNLYQEKTANGSQEEAIKIAMKMNQAKAEYERLKGSFSR